MTVLDIHPEASAELIATLAWYDDQRAGLGAELDDAVYLRPCAIPPRPALFPSVTPIVAKIWQSCLPTGGR